MKIVLSSRGSRGDVYPVIEIAAGLKKAGHEPIICVPRDFEDYALKQGVITTVYKNEDAQKLMKDLGSGLGAMKKAMNLFAGSVDEQFEFMLSATENADALITTVNEIAAPTVAEYRKIPHYRVTFTPALPGNHPPPFMPWQNLPPAINRTGWKGLAMISKFIINKFINKKREELGLKPAKSSDRYHTGNSHTLLAINRELAPPCRVWDKKYKYDYTGYCYGQIFGNLKPELLNFIENGEPPVYIGFGSVHLKNPEMFTDMVVKAAKDTGTRILIGKGWTGLGNGYINENIYTIGDTPHGSLFPKMACIIHHGGSGTTHTAARSGIPQFILPQIIDQYYWGNRIYKKGLGPKPVIPKKITVEKLKAVMRELENENYRKQAQQLAQSMQNEDGVQKIINIVTGK
ncbi:MAG: glycosyltransferase family 1 protein [Chlorobi bacterium]|nr:glycosyltransferase family 1 protein [Chlorobiota bacterium]